MPLCKATTLSLHTKAAGFQQPQYYSADHRARPWHVTSSRCLLCQNAIDNDEFGEALKEFVKA